MANMNTVNANLCTALFNEIHLTDYGYTLVNARAFCEVVTDENGDERYVKISITVTALNVEISAERKMQSDIKDYTETQERKAAKAAAQAKQKELEAALKAKIAEMIATEDTETK